MTKPLTATLTTLITQSAIDGQPHERTLKRGLTVRVHLTPIKLTLATWRANQPPDLTEWQIVFDHLPVQYRTVTRPEPVPYHADGKNMLSASWPVLKLI